MLGFYCLPQVAWFRRENARVKIETESCLAKSENEEEWERVRVEGVGTKGTNVLTMCSE